MSAPLIDLRHSRPDLSRKRDAARQFTVTSDPSDEVVQIVRLLDGFNRHRFAAEPDLLAAWSAACNVVGPPRTGGQADGQTV